MHFEILVEDSSGARLLEILLPKLLQAHTANPTWRVHAYKGIGRIPAGLTNTPDPRKRILLDRLPMILRGYRNTPGIDAVVVVVDADNRDCKAFLRELNAVAIDCDFAERTMFRLAIEELEAWYFGDRAAILTSYPRARRHMLDAYEQDSVCATWEHLAVALRFADANASARRLGGDAGRIKHEWAERIGPVMDVEQNQSPSFCKLRDGLRRLLLAAC